MPDKVQTSNFLCLEFYCHLFIAFLMIRKRDSDRRVHLRPHKNDRQQDFLLKSPFLLEHFGEDAIGRDGHGHGHVFKS